MKALITGISGFVGANLARYLLKRGHEVTGFVRNPASIWRLEEVKDRIEFYSGDLLDKDSIYRSVLEAKPDVIFHFAVYDYHKKEIETIFGTGVFATMHLLEAAKRVGVKMFVNAGSSSEYGAKKEPMREDQILEPNSYYAIGKAAQTHLVSHFSKTEKIPAVTLRLFSVYGPYEEEKRFIPTLIRSALNNQTMPLNSGSNARDFIYVGDVCDACERAMHATLFGDAINIGSGVQRTLMDMFSEVKKITGSSMSASVGAYENREFDTTRWVADCAFAKRVIDFEAMTNYSDGLKWTVDWFQKSGKIPAGC